MFFNNLKIAFRTLRKNKIYTAITFIGLTVGIAAALLIFQMVSYELSFNQHFEKYDRIVRVVQEQRNTDGSMAFNVCTPIPAMDLIEERVGQFETMSRIKEFWPTVVALEGSMPVKKFTLEDGQTAFFVEPAFFDIFDLDWKSGNPATALEGPDKIVLTEGFAKKFFERPDAAMGQHLIIDNVVTLTVTGIVADLPDNCDFPIPFFGSRETIKANPDYFFYSEQWGNCSSNDQIYALLQSPDQKDEANEVLAGIGAEEYKDRTGKKMRTHVLQPLADLHFDERYGHSGTHEVSKSRLNILSGVGILILVMACFNFINLATAQSSLRAKEVGVRKTLGSNRPQLMGQFLSETALIVLSSAVLGLLLAYWSLPLLKYISDVPATAPFLSDPAVWIFLVVVALVVTLLSGVYPALVMAGFRPIEALQNKVSRGSFQGVALRKSLVVLQFVIAQGLIIGAIITLLQMEYVRTRDLGFSKDLIYTFGVGIDSTTLNRQQALKQELLQIPAVEAISLSSDQPLSGNTWMQSFRYDSRPEDESFAIATKFADADYPKTYDIKMAAGKWYDRSDTMRQAVVNRTLLERLDIDEPGEVLGKTLFLGGGRGLEITGVVEDFHTHPLQEAKTPLFMTSYKDFYWEVGAKIRPDNIAATLGAMRTAFDKVLPDQVFEGRFLDERIAAFYESENRLAATCKGFGLLAILISCLGLFGLAAHAAQQRVKEIGVRKVLGATTAGIVSMLSRDFLKLVVVALVIATPIAYFLMRSWLNDFEYRIDIQWWVFLLTGLIAIMVAFLTVGFQSLRAAWSNPVDSLRNE